MRAWRFAKRGRFLAQVRRIAVGTPHGRRSTVWKFDARKSDVYIHTRMFGSEAKVSLHESGDCQWSCTDDWVKRVPGRKNVERDMQRWHLARPDGTAQHIFRIRIPETELRKVDPERKLTKVHWLPPPPEGQTVSLECYITSVSDQDPALTASLPHPHLFSLPLSDSRWFVVLHQLLPLDKERLEHRRKQMRADAELAGLVPNSNHRACVFTVADEGDARGLIEFCLV